MIHENCVAYPRISSPGSVQHVKTSDASESQNGYPGKFNSFAYCFITYVFYVLERHKYPINSYSFKIQSFQNQFLERQVIALWCLLCVCWHWLSQIGLIYGNIVTSEPYQVAWLTYPRDRLPSRGTWTRSRSGSMGSSWGSARPRPTPRSCIWVGVIPSINTDWGMSELKPVLLRKTWGCWWRRSWRWAGNVHSHNWKIIQGEKVWFFFFPSRLSGCMCILLNIILLGKVGRVFSLFKES